MRGLFAALCFTCVTACLPTSDDAGICAEHGLEDVTCDNIREVLDRVETADCKTVSCGLNATEQECTDAGCRWPARVCAPAFDCALPVDLCTQQPTCTVEPWIFCAEKCQSDTEQACATEPFCHWQNGRCRPDDCNAGNCEASPFCERGADHCEPLGCFNFDEATCRQEPGCHWNSAVCYHKPCPEDCTGHCGIIDTTRCVDAAGCNSLDGAACESNPACVWPPQEPCDSAFCALDTVACLRDAVRSCRDVELLF